MRCRSNRSVRGGLRAAALTDQLGIDIPIIQAPMGYIARAQLASAVSNVGDGIVETSSGRLERSSSRSRRCATSRTSRGA